MTQRTRKPLVFLTYEQKLEAAGAEGTNAEVAKRFGVAVTSIWKWRNGYDLNPSAAPRGRRPKSKPLPQADHRVLTVQEWRAELLAERKSSLP